MPTLPIFVSSTFRDFHVERDMLRTLVVPRLDAVLAPLGSHAELVDLRWGVETREIDDDEYRQALVVDVCRDEIDRCQPMFLVFVGQRYGWMPDTIRVQGPPRSITEIELDHAQRMGVPVVAAVRTLQGSFPESWVDVDPTNASKLRDRVVREALPTLEPVQYVFTLSDGKPAEAEMEMLADALLSKLVPLARARVQELSAHDAASTDSTPGERLVIESRSAIAVGRDDLIAEIASSLQEPYGASVVLVGPSGVGKTTVLLQVIERLQATGRRVVRVMIGVTPDSTSLRGVATTIAHRAGIELPVEDDIKALDQFLAWWRQALVAMGSEWIIALDGLEQLVPEEGVRDLVLLSRLASGTPRFVCSTMSTPDSAILRLRGFNVFEVGPLGRASVLQAVRAWARHSSRELPNEAAALMGVKPRSGLWTRLAVASLAWLDKEDYAEAEAAAAAGKAPDQALADVIIDRTALLPDSDGELARGFLERAGAELGADGANRFLRALAMSRSGMTQDQLGRFAGVEPLTSSRARWLLGDALAAEPSTGRLAFAHRLLDEVATHEMSTAEMVDFHSQLATFCGGEESPTPHQHADAAWHALVGKRPDLAISHLANLQAGASSETLVADALVTARPLEDSAADTLRGMSAMDWAPPERSNAAKALIGAALDADQRGLSSTERASLVFAVALPMLRARTNPGDSLLYAMGTVFADSENFDLAADCFRQCAQTLESQPEMASQRAQALTKLAQVELASARPGEAIAAAREALEAADELCRAAAMTSHAVEVHARALLALREAAKLAGDRVAYAGAVDRLQREHGIEPPDRRNDDVARARAMVERRERLDQARRAWAESPTDIGLADKLIDSLMAVAVGASTNESQSLFDEAEGLAERIHVSVESSRTRDTLARTLTVRAAWHLDQGDLNAAEGLAQAASDTVREAESVAGAHLKLQARALWAQAVAKQRRVAIGLEALTEAIDDFKRAHSEVPSQDVRMKLLHAQSTLSRMAVEGGDTATAVSAVVEIINSWFDPEPLIMHAGDALPLMLQAFRLMRSLNPQSHGAEIRAMAAAFGRLGRDAHPDLNLPETLRLSSVAMGRVRLAEVEREEDNLAKAASAAADAVASYERCIELGKGLYLQDLLHALNLLANVEKARGEIGAAEGAWRRGVQISNIVFTSGSEPGATDYRTRVILHFRLGELERLRAERRRILGRRKPRFPEEWRHANAWLDEMEAKGLLRDSDVALRDAVRQQSHKT